MANPVLKIDAGKYPELAENVWHAQKAGHPKVLTYIGPDLARQHPDIATKKENRNEAMHYELGDERYKIPQILSRDEYPFACTLEGGKSSWVGHIPGKQNSAQGGLIAQFLKANQIKPFIGIERQRKISTFEVEVVGYKHGSAISSRIIPKRR